MSDVTNETPQDTTEGEATPEVKQEQQTGEAKPQGEAKPAEGAAKVVPEKYDLKLPKDSALDSSDLERIASYAKEQGLSQ